MLFEYAVEPQAIGSSWQNFRYLIEKFGFDRGRLISQFPKAWLREVYAASTAMKPMERKRLEERLNQAKQSKLIRSGRPYDPTVGSWVDNAIAQQATTPFRAIISQHNPSARSDIVLADEVDETHPLMISPHTWEVDRIGRLIAQAMGPILRNARTVLFVDRFFDIRKDRYKETLKSCLDLLATSGSSPQVEIHFCDHDARPPVGLMERDAGKWLQGVIPAGMSITLFAWKERAGGADFHARYLLTDIGGLNVEAGFSAEGAHQKVQLGLLSHDLAQDKLSAFARSAIVYELIEPILCVNSDGSVGRVT